METSPHVVITHRGEDRLRAGHPWIYRSDLVETHATGGDLVSVQGARGRRLGSALYSDRSEIALRVVARGDAPVDESLWADRIATAITYRDGLRLDADAYRLVHAEADLLPSLVVDRYGDYLVMQALSQGMDRRQTQLAALLAERLGVSGILARNDARVRTLEGLEMRVDLLHGTVPERVQVREGPVRYDVDLRKGQKTGLFLDQRENREAAALYAHGRLLDCFSYHGGFALRLASRCASVLALDVSEAAVAQIQANAAQNGVSNLEARAGNVFDELRDFERSGERFDTIVLDPPAFAKNRAALEKARAGYKEINLRALKLLTPGGYLVTCSCSYHVTEAMLGELVHEAALDAHASVTVVEKRMQGRDHPVLLGVPETYYLKCFILRRLS